MTRARRSGFTLVETLVALTLLSVLITAALAALDRQVKMFSAGTTQMDAMQNGRFALNTLEKDLPTTGTNIAADQPFVVYADTSVIVFNADYVSNVAGDVSAIYVDTAASASYSSAARSNAQFRLPLSNIYYPAVNYLVGGQNSPAETIIFYFTPDTITARTDDYTLLRQVNGNAPDLIARGILHNGSTPFFTYQRKIVPLSGSPYLQAVSPAALPMRHSIPQHLAATDTGNLAFIDQVRAVQVSFRVTDDRPGAQQRIFSIARTIALPNAGLGTKQTCGDAPILGNTSFAAAVITPAAGQTAVRLTWNRAADELGGERDVVRYVIYRQEMSGPVTDPYLSIAAGQANYVFDDYNVTPGATYYYSIAAQDCTPSLSDVATLAPIVIP